MRKNIQSLNLHWCNMSKNLVETNTGVAVTFPALKYSTSWIYRSLCPDDFQTILVTFRADRCTGMPIFIDRYGDIADKIR